MEPLVRLVGFFVAFLLIFPTNSQHLPKYILVHVDSHENSMENRGVRKLFQSANSRKLQSNLEPTLSYSKVAPPKLPKGQGGLRYCFKIFNNVKSMKELVLKCLDYFNVPHEGLSSSSEEARLSQDYSEAFQNAITDDSNNEESNFNDEENDENNAGDEEEVPKNEVSRKKASNRFFLLKKIGAALAAKKAAFVKHIHHKRHRPRSPPPPVRRPPPPPPRRPPPPPPPPVHRPPPPPPMPPAKPIFHHQQNVQSHIKQDGKTKQHQKPIDPLKFWTPFSPSAEDNKKHTHSVINRPTYSNQLKNSYSNHIKSVSSKNHIKNEHNLLSTHNQNFKSHFSSSTNNHNAGIYSHSNPIKLSGHSVSNLQNHGQNIVKSSPFGY